ncbi:MAG TPA: site-2 protease family protein [Anaerolineaceae bacterium]
MDNHIKIGKLFGIPFGLHWSWFIIFVMVSWSLASGYFPQEYTGMSSLLYIILGIVTSLLFFASVFAHELGHSLVALREKIPVKNITLFIFGGVAQIGQEPKKPGAEFRIAIAGPATSLALAGVFGLLYLLDQAFPYLAAPSIWLARINLSLAIFNLIPGFPLDGGRVLRSIVWGITKDFQKATRVATFSGQLVAFGFIGVGVFIMIGGNFLNGLWLVLIGWFLQNAAASTYAQVHTQHSMSTLKVSQVMDEQFESVPGNMTIERLIEERVLSGGHRFFLVFNYDKPIGVLTLQDLTRVPRQQWQEVTARVIMTPWDKLIRVRPEDNLFIALQAMDTGGVGQVPVVSNEQIMGLLSRDKIIHYLRTRAELGF